MIKTLTNLFKQDKEKFVVPKGVQDVIPVAAIFDDGIFKVGKDKYSKTYRFTDINYAVASREDKEAMFLEYSELLNSLDSGATTKITINNRRLNRLDFEQTILIPTTGDNLDEYREEYNKMLLDKATGANSIVQDKYITISINKKKLEAQKQLADLLPEKPECIQEKYWNEKIYGKTGKYFIYLDGNKVNIPDEKAAELEEYLGNMRKYREKKKELMERQKDGQ